MMPPQIPHCMLQDYTHLVTPIASSSLPLRKVTNTNWSR
jgi:hypothetical protein